MSWLNIWTWDRLLEPLYTILLKYYDFIVGYTINIVLLKQIILYSNYISLRCRDSKAIAVEINRSKLPFIE